MTQKHRCCDQRASRLRVGTVQRVCERAHARVLHVFNWPIMWVNGSDCQVAPSSWTPAFSSRPQFLTPPYLHLSHTPVSVTTLKCLLAPWTTIIVAEEGQMLTRHSDFSNSIKQPSCLLLLALWSSEGNILPNVAVAGPAYRVIRVAKLLPILVAPSSFLPSRTLRRHTYKKKKSDSYLLLYWTNCDDRGEKLLSNTVQRTPD